MLTEETAKKVLSLLTGTTSRIYNYSTTSSNTTTYYGGNKWIGLFTSAIADYALANNVTAVTVSECEPSADMGYARVRLDTQFNMDDMEYDTEHDVFIVRNNAPIMFPEAHRADGQAEWNDIQYFGIFTDTGEKALGSDSSAVPIFIGKLDDTVNAVDGNVVLFRENYLKIIVDGITHE